MNLYFCLINMNKYNQISNIILKEGLDNKLRHISSFITNKKYEFFSAKDKKHF